jgi:hypothetical protein
MKTQEISIIALLFLAIAALMATPVILEVSAQQGVPFEKNFGQCKKDKNENACANQK